MKKKIILLFLFVLATFSGWAQSVSFTSSALTTAQAGTTVTVNYQYTHSNPDALMFCEIRRQTTTGTFVSTVVSASLNPAVAGTSLTGSFNLAIPSGTTPTASLPSTDVYRIRMEIRTITGNTFITGVYPTANINITAAAAVNAVSFTSPTLTTAQAGTTVTVNYQYTHSNPDALMFCEIRRQTLTGSVFVSSIVSASLNPAVAGTSLTGSFNLAIPSGTTPTASLPSTDVYRIRMEIRTITGNTFITGVYPTANINITPAAAVNAVSFTSPTLTTAQAGTSVSVDYKYTTATDAYLYCEIRRQTTGGAWEQTVVGTDLNPAIAGTDVTGSFNLAIPASTTPTSSLSGSVYRLRIEMKASQFGSFVTGSFPATNIDITSPPTPVVSQLSSDGSNTITQACEGSAISIIGNNFYSVSAVTVGGVAVASFAVVSDNRIDAILPMGAISGVVAVTTPSGTGSSSAPFNTIVISTNTTTVSSPLTYTWANNGETYTTSGIKTGTTTNCVTELLDLTILTTEIPTTFPAFCKGATVATATGSTSLKFYSALSGGLALGGTTALVTGKTLFVTETINSVESSPRVGRLITVNVIPATPASMTTTDAVLCKYVGTTNTVTYTVATVATATSYLWSVPAGANVITDASATDNVITVDFLNSPLNNITVGGLGTIAARAVNSFDCPSLPRSLVLTAKLPTAPTSLTLTSADTTDHFNVPVPGSSPIQYTFSSLADLQKITKVGPYMGTPTVFTLTAPVAPTAASYEWTLPSGATQLTGDNGRIITVDFAGVPAGIGALPVVVKSAGGCGKSTARTLTLARTVPGAPTALTLTNTSQSNLSALTKITKVGPYTGTSIQFTLRATPFLTQGATSTSYAWILPAGVTCETTNTPTNVLQRVAVPITVENPSGFVINSFAAISTPTNVITVNFNGATGTGNLDLLVFGVNGAGNSVARKLVLARALPTAPTKLVLTDPAISTTVNPLANIVTKVGPYVGETTSLTLTATPFITQGAEATSYTWTLPAGVTVTAGATLVSGNTWTSTGTVLTVNFDGVAPAVLSLPLSVQAVNGAGTSATTRTLTLTSAAPTTPSAITTPSSAIPTFNPACSSTITVQVLNVFGVTYAWNVGGTEAVITGGQGTNSITIDVSAVTTTTLAVSVVGSNGTGNSPTRALTIKKAATCREASTSIANEFSVIAYPNPSSSEFTIKSSAKGEISVKVYDMQGRLVEKTNTDKVGSRLAAGAYNVIVNQGANVKTLRVIKK